jgi:hypothetical protein
MEGEMMVQVEAQRKVQMACMELGLNGRFGPDHVYSWLKKEYPRTTPTKRTVRKYCRMASYLKTVGHYYIYISKNKYELPLYEVIP